MCSACITICPSASNSAGRGVAALLDVRGVGRADQHHPISSQAARSPPVSTCSSIGSRVIARTGAPCSQRDRAVRVDLGRPAGRDQQRRRRAARTAPGRRARVPGAGSPRSTVGVERRAVEDDLCALAPDARRAASPRRGAQLRRRPPHRGAQVDELDLGLLVAVAVARRRAPRRRLRAAARRRAPRPQRALRRRAARRTGRGSAARGARAPEPGSRRARARLGEQLGRGGLEALRPSSCPASPASPCARHRGAAATAARPSAESTPQARGQSTREMPRPSASAAACSGPAPPNGISANATRVDTALDRHHAQRAEHLRLGHAHDALGARVQGEPQLGRQRRDARARPQRGPGGHPPASGASAGSRPEQQVRVGDRRPLPAAPIAGGAGLGARRGRADAQRAAGVAPGDRAAAGADRVDVERGQRHAGARRSPARWSRGPASRDQADVAGGAAHVEARDVAARRRGLRRAAAPADPARGAREHGQRRVRARPRRVRETARGLHDLRLGAGPLRARLSRKGPRR